MTQEYKELPLKSIKIESGRRPLNPAKVDELAESINENGLLSPLTINKRNNTLVAGRHRYEAVKKLKWDIVPCLLSDYDDVVAQLVEIDENLRRNDLTEMERVMYEARRDKLIKQKTPDFEDQQKELEVRAAKARKGVGALQGDIRLGDKLQDHLPVKAQKAIIGTSFADNKKQLSKLADLEDDADKIAVAEKIGAGEARTVEEAQRLLKKEDSHAGVDESDAAKFLRLFEKLEPQMRKFLDGKSMDRLLEIWTDEAKMDARDVLYNIRDHSDRIHKHCIVLIKQISSKLD